MSSFSWPNKQNVVVLKINMWCPHSPDQTNKTLSYLRLICAVHILLTKQEKRCRIKDKYVMSTFSWPNKQNVIVLKISLVRRMWTSHIYLKYDNVLFVWSGECGHHIFIFNTTTFCLFGQENVDSTYLSLIRQHFVCLVRRMWTSHIYL
jgi:hypothetical protein